MSVTRQLVLSLSPPDSNFIQATTIVTRGAESEALRWLSIANGLGLHEADDVYIPVMLTAWLIVAVVAYIAIMKLWRHHRGKEPH
ncbi:MULTISPECIES: hypothetical protein [unclassified Paraburkholderia]|uniref:hypothetical protein n=1 Tax=unclassified Paraburkholderia TaxID=2615204 RepID=UPI002889DC8B|nr:MULTISPECIES: hypothetical protein [unclassified Paraburkholderia]